MSLSIQGVGKEYRNGHWGVRDINLEIPAGVLGFLGPNGAGKSTLMRIIASIMQPSTGKVIWQGQDIRQNLREYRRVLGYLPQDFGVYPQLNSQEFLGYMAALKGIAARDAQKQIQELLRLVNLEDAGKRPIGKLSGGMRQRVGIAQALLGNPQILIVDEPTVGLDPEERMRFRHLLSDMGAERTVIFSTHIVSDIEATAGSIALASRGRLIIHSTPEDLIQKTRGKVWELTVTGDEIPAMRKQWLIASTVRTTDGVRVRVIAQETPAGNASHMEPTLEDAYLYHIAIDKAGDHR